jgi:hypothetical protein
VGRKRRARLERPASRASGAKSSGKTPPEKSGEQITLAAANKWLAEEHDLVLKVAERNTIRLIGKPGL